MDLIADWKNLIVAFDERRDLAITGNGEEAVRFAVTQFIQIGSAAIRERGRFTIALSGGNTPAAIYRELGKPLHYQSLDWSKVFFFWSDERCVPPTSSESNYHNALEAGLKNLPLQADHIFRMVAEDDIEENALAYEMLVRQNVPSQQFDLIMLGMGEDGHTASLFPLTHGLHAHERLIIANYVPQKQTWRMTMTFECINNARSICIYTLGANKSAMVAKVLRGPYDPDQFPVQRVGTPTHKALWVLDRDAGRELFSKE